MNENLAVCARFCGHHLYRMALMPVTIVFSVWITAKKTYRCVHHYLYKPSFHRTPEEQARFDQIKAKLSRQEPVPAPHRDEGSAFDFARVNVKPAQGIPVLCQQLVLTFFKEATAKKNQSLDNNYTNEIIEQITEFISRYLIEVADHLNVSKLLNKILDYFIDEVNAHQQATYAVNKEREKIEFYRKTIYDFNHQNDLDEGSYIPRESEKIEAEGYLQSIASPALVLSEERTENYLENLYATVFAEQKAGRKEDHSIDDLGAEMTEKVLTYCQPLIGKMIEQNILGAAFTEEPFTVNVLNPVLKPLMVQWLNKIISPDQLKILLSHILISNLTEGFIINLCKNIIKTQWEEMEPLLYLYQVTPGERKEIGETIKEKLWTQINTVIGPEIPQAGFNSIVDKMLPKLTTGLFYIQMMIAKEDQNSATFKNLSLAFWELIVSEENEARETWLENIKFALCAMLPDGYQDDEKMEAFANSLDPIITHIEKHLLSLQKRDPDFGLEEVNTGIKTAWSSIIDEEDINTKFGDLAFKIFELSQFAPYLLWTAQGGLVKTAVNWVLPKSWSDAILNPVTVNWIKDPINKAASGAAEPYLSPKGLLREIQKTLEEKLNTAGHPPSVNPLQGLDLDQEFALLSKVIFDFVLRQTPGKLQGAVKLAIGTDSADLNGLLHKIHNIFFSHAEVNLNRVKAIAGIVFHQLDKAHGCIISQRIKADRLPIGDNEKGKEKETN